MITIGTCYFPDRQAAGRYYRSFLDVDRKLRDGEIKLGRPPLRDGERLVLIDQGLRYAIETDSNVLEVESLPERNSEMIERAANALKDAGVYGNIATADDLAHAALAAIEEPTEAMIDAGIPPYRFHYPLGTEAERAQVKSIFRAMHKAMMGK